MRLKTLLVALTINLLVISSANADQDANKNTLSNGEYLSSLDTARGFNQIAQHPISPQQKKEIFAPVLRLFDGMREHNKAKMISAFAEKASIIRASRSGQLKYTDVVGFADSIAKRKNDMMDERIINYRIQQFDNLASIWTYFVFYYNGKISHCGVNAIQVVKFEKEWKIGSLMDTAAKGSCEEFILDYEFNGKP